MEHKPDAVTRWWRRISLRAKVTGVTVAVLALGLLAAGIGTVPILRNALISNIDTQLAALVETDLADRFFVVSADDGELRFEDRENAPRSTEYIVAFYSAEGDLIARAGGSAGSAVPNFPETFPLTMTHLVADEAPFALRGDEGALFHGGVFMKEGPGGVFYTQFVAMPLDEADRIVALYFGVYTTVALITIFIAALLTRGLVTLTFRRLGQAESTAMSIAAGDFSQRLTDLEPTTEVGRLNSAINTMLDRVDHSIAQRDRTVAHMRRFIGDASHELRTPLVSVRGYAELYRMGAIKGDEDTARAMERIEKEAIRMGVLVEDLLALARLDEEREIEISPIDLRPVARDAALDVRAAAPGREVTVIDTTLDEAMDAVASVMPPLTKPAGRSTPTARGLAGATFARLRRRPRGAEEAPGAPVAAAAGSAESTPTIDFRESTDVPVRTPPIVRGEENKVRQIVTNLLGNARRFSAEDAPIEIVVGADRAREVGWIAVVDHGEGIPPQIRDQIFERFWRADTSRARETGGSGLGLAIVASLVTALRGGVRVTETDGGGATFTVTLPLAPPQATPAHLLEETQPLDRLDL